MLLRFWGSTPWPTRAIQKLMFRKLRFLLAVTCNLCRIVLPNVSLQRPTSRHLRFAMLKNTLCYLVALLQSALPPTLSRFGPGVRGLSPLGPIVLPSPGLPLGPLGPQGPPESTSTRVCLGSLPPSRRMNHVDVSCHVRALD